MTDDVFSVSREDCQYIDPQCNWYG